MEHACTFMDKFSLMTIKSLLHIYLKATYYKWQSICFNALDCQRSDIKHYIENFLKIVFTIVYFSQIATHMSIKEGRGFKPCGTNDRQQNNSPACKKKSREFMKHKSVINIS